LRAAIDPCSGLPALHDFPPTIKQAKDFLDRIRAEERQRQYFLEKANEPKLIEPPPDPGMRNRVGEQMRQLANRLRNGPSAA